MIKERVCANDEALPSEQVEKIAQLALVGQAALNTNLTSTHIGNAVATLFEVIAEISDDTVQQLQEKEQVKNKA